jgi:hypothetical protein
MEEMVVAQPLRAVFALRVVALVGCAASKTERDLTDYGPAQDHRKIAACDSHEAAKRRQFSEETSVRINVYEQLFGPTSDWVTGARLLAQSYENAAKEYERMVCKHLELIHESGPPPSGSRDFLGPTDSLHPGAKTVR